MRLALNLSEAVAADEGVLGRVDDEALLGQPRPVAVIGAVIDVGVD